MKTQRKNILRSISKKTIFLFSAILFSLFLTISDVKADYEPCTKDDVVEYLGGFGIIAESLNELVPSEDWLTTNRDGSQTRVYVYQGNIVGHEDVDF